MRKAMLSTGFVVVLALCAACSGSPPPVQTAVEQGQPALVPSVIQPDKVTVDYRGASLGGQIPEWVLWVAEGDPDNQLADLPRVQGKKTIVVQNSGQDLDLLQAWVNLQALSDASIMIKTNVNTEAGSGLEGNKNTPGNRSAVNQFINIFSETEISGLGRDLDFWVKERSASTGAENYVYYVVFGIEEDNFNHLIAQALGKVKAETEEEQDMLNEIEDRMRRLRFRATGE
jgi:hypothetical protein